MASVEAINALSDDIRGIREYIHTSAEETKTQITAQIKAEMNKNIYGVAIDMISLAISICFNHREMGINCRSS